MRSNDKCDIVIIEDHELTCSGLEFLLSGEPTFEVVGTARTGTDALLVVDSASPHIVILDLALPGASGLTVLEELKTRFPNTKVLVLSGQASGTEFHLALNLGANGLVSKAENASIVIEALREVATGRSYVSDQIRALIGPIMDDKSGTALTGREREVMTLIAEGNSTGDIGIALGVSEGTARKHRENLMRKLGLHTASDVTRKAVELGLVSLP